MMLGVNVGISMIQVFVRMTLQRRWRAWLNFHRGLLDQNYSASVTPVSDQSIEKTCD